jgi:hypothetical protein
VISLLIIIVSLLVIGIYLRILMHQWVFATNFQLELLLGAIEEGSHKPQIFF